MNIYEFLILLFLLAEKKNPRKTGSKIDLLEELFLYVHFGVRHSSAALAVALQIPPKEEIGRTGEELVEDSLSRYETRWLKVGLVVKHKGRIYFPHDEANDRRKERYPFSRKPTKSKLFDEAAKIYEEMLDCEEFAAMEVEDHT